MEKTYEYAEVGVGHFGRGRGVPALLFLQVCDITGRKITPDWADGQLDALNLMGAQGWQYLSQCEATAGRMGHIWATLKGHDDRVDLDIWQALTCPTALQHRSAGSTTSPQPAHASADPADTLAPPARHRPS